MRRLDKCVLRALYTLYCLSHTYSVVSLFLRCFQFFHCRGGFRFTVRLAIHFFEGLHNFLHQFGNVLLRKEVTTRLLRAVPLPVVGLLHFLLCTMALATLADVWAQEAFLVVMPGVGDDFFVDFFGFRRPILSGKFCSLVARGTWLCTAAHALLQKCVTSWLRYFPPTLRQQIRGRPTKSKWSQIPVCDPDHGYALSPAPLIKNLLRLLYSY